MIGVFVLLFAAISSQAKPQNLQLDDNSFVNFILNSPPDSALFGGSGSPPENNVFQPTEIQGQGDQFDANSFLNKILSVQPGSSPSAVPASPNINNVPHQTETHGKTCRCVERRRCGDFDIRTPFANPNGPPNNLVVTVNSPSQGCVDPHEMCCRNVLSDPLDLFLPPHTSRCGTHNQQGVGIDIHGFKGGEAQFGEFPWMVAVMVDGVYRFAGSLIHPSVVLTVAHHAKKWPDFTLVARLGEWNLHTTTEVIPYQEIRVREVVTHPNYNAETIDNDVSLLILERPVRLSQTMDVICLPSSFDSFHGSRCMSGGWGTKKWVASEPYSNILKRVNLPFIDHSSCQGALRRTRLGPNFVLGSTWVCAGGEKEDTCTGDGGAPLVCPDPINPTRLVQVGLVAWGIGCGDNVPGVYSSVQTALPWLRHELTRRYGSSVATYFP